MRKRKPAALLYRGAAAAGAAQLAGAEAGGYTPVRMRVY